MRICSRYVSDKMLAEDLVQEIFMKLIDGRSSFMGLSQESTWIHRVAVNHCIDHLRRSKRRRELLDQFSPELMVDYEEADPVAEENPLLGLLRESLEELDMGWKQIVFLRYEVGMTHVQIAEIYGLSRVAITRRLNRFQQRLEKKLRAKQSLREVN